MQPGHQNLSHPRAYPKGSRSTSSTSDSNSVLAYILVASDTHSSLLNKASARAVADLCLDSSLWALGSRRVSAPKQGSNVLIYLAGKREESQTFVAHARIAGAAIQHRFEIDDRVWTRTFPLAGIRRFRAPVPIEPFLPLLGFPQVRWGSRLQGGIVQIPNTGFKAVCNAGTGRGWPKRNDLVPT
jgi:hypothetical protein